MMQVESSSVSSLLGLVVVFKLLSSLVYRTPKLPVEFHERLTQIHSKQQNNQKEPGTPMMSTCTACATSFLVSDDDRAFYTKISPVFDHEKFDIPSPTLCPTCRNVRRMTWRNDRSFYHRTCDLTRKRIIALYPEEAPFPVYQTSAWYSDAWDPMDFGQDIDFNRPFFEQWQELLQRVPRLSLDLVNCENSEYCNYCGDDKNCYLDIAGEGNEDCFYNLFTKHSKDCVDCTFVYNSTLCYSCINSYNCYSTQYSMYLENCSDCIFCYDLKGCSDCAFSWNLRNQKYHIFNKPHTKEEYEKKLASYKLNSRKVVQELSLKWLKHRTQHAAYRDMYLLNCENCLGNNIKNSKNCFSVYNVSNCEDSKYLYDVLDAKLCYDLNYSLYKPEASYELISTLQMSYSAFNMASHYCGNVFYCDLTNNSSELFGCIGLNQKKHCILNKQYSKDEYEKQVARLVRHMIETGEWGEFFPSAISPFAYNETVAQEYFPLSQEVVESKSLRWKRAEQKEYREASAALPDEIAQADEAVTKEIFACEFCKKNYKIISAELSFYKKEGIPLPCHCPECRHLQRLGLRTTRRLWERICSNCSSTTQSTFSPDLPEQILCESCYLQVVRD